jgi:hypothetical protein
LHSQITPFGVARPFEFDLFSVSDSCAAKPAFAAHRVAKLANADKLGANHWGNNHLRDSVPWADRENLVAVIDQDDANLAAKIFIDGARCIQDSNPAFLRDA